MIARLWQRLRDVVVHRIIGVADTPHRIAWGMFLGTVIAWTPTIGLQIVLYIAFATLLRANKVSGIPILFISNPFTAVPLYYSAWWVGNAVTHLGSAEGAGPPTDLVHFDPDSYGDFLSKQFWSDVGNALLALGGELWLGCLIVGIAMGIPGYLLTYWAVNAYRRSRGAHAEH